jgi:hypothetical protein
VRQGFGHFAASIITENDEGWVKAKVCYRKKMELPLLVYKDAKLRGCVPDPVFLSAVRVVYSIFTMRPA